MDEDNWLHQFLQVISWNLKNIEHEIPGTPIDQAALDAMIDGTRTDLDIILF